MRLIAKLASAAAVLSLSVVMAQPTYAAGAADYIKDTKRVDWSFSGLFGSYDEAQLQRGFKVFKEVCAACHSLNYIAFRNLGEEGGPHFPEDQVKALAAEYDIVDGPNAEGEMFERSGVPSDMWPSPYENVQQAASLNNGAAPPDLSLMAKARSAHFKRKYMVLSDFASWGHDIATQYQEGGADYIYSLLSGYSDDAPKEAHPEKNQESNFNPYYAPGGGWIAMASPLSDELVEYTDGSPETVDQYAKDVTAFLMWTAEPHLNARKQSGMIVISFLIIFAGLLFAAKKKVWSDVDRDDKDH